MWQSVGYDTQDASEAELTKLKENADVQTTIQGNATATADIDSVIYQSVSFIVESKRT